ncbi:MAG: hypothetical protein ACYDAM_10865 [Leptospirales bacterium]
MARRQSESLLLGRDTPRNSSSVQWLDAERWARFFEDRLSYAQAVTGLFLQRIHQNLLHGNAPALLHESAVRPVPVRKAGWKLTPILVPDRPPEPPEELFLAKSITRPSGSTVSPLSCKVRSTMRQFISLGMPPYSSSPVGDKSPATAATWSFQRRSGPWIRSIVFSPNSILQIFMRKIVQENFFRVHSFLMGQDQP